MAEGLVWRLAERMLRGRGMGERIGEREAAIFALAAEGLEGLDDEGLDRLERTGAVLVQAALLEGERRAGIRRARSLDGGRHPFPTDHAAVERHPAADGRPARTVYVAEPYALSGSEQLARLAELAAAGWEVTISGDSQHYPGRSVRVALERRKP
jgi:hypothetical protein